MIINVIFIDETETVVRGYFGSPQDAAAWPNQGQIETSDQRWATYYNGLPEGMRDGLPKPD
jgi:hypothetical protein